VHRFDLFHTIRTFLLEGHFLEAAVKQKQMWKSKIGSHCLLENNWVGTKASKHVLELGVLVMGIWQILLPSVTFLAM
jgi:hypothetical protein